MEIELHPAVSLVEETFNVLVAPVEMLVDALNGHLNLQRYDVSSFSLICKSAAITGLGQKVTLD